MIRKYKRKHRFESMLSANKRGKDYLGIVCVIVSAIIFGLMPLGAKYVYANGSNSITLTFHRVLFSTPVLFIFAKRKSKDPIKISISQLKDIFILSIGYISTPLLLLASYNYISTGTATTVHFIYPVLVLIGCAILFNEKINLVRGICTILCMLGLVTFYTPGDTVTGVGLAISFLSGITYAFYVIYIAKSKLKGLNTYLVAFYLSLIGSLEVLILALFTNTLTFDLSPGAWLVSIVFALATSGLATILFQTGTKIVGPQRSSLLSTFEPLTSVLVGVLIFGEKLTLVSAIGMVLILTSVVLLGIFDS